MTRFGSGQALAWVREAIRAYADNGWGRSIKPGYGIHSRVTSRSGDVAGVADVQDWALWPLIDVKTGQVVPGSTPRQCITAELTRRDVAWTVTTLMFAQSGC